MNFKGRSFKSLFDYTKEEIIYLIDKSISLKKEKQNNIFPQRLKNKSIALIFEKNSTRTRCSTSVACFDEGAHAEFLGKDDIQMGDKESIKDTARVLGRMYDGILFRGFEQDTVDKLAEYSGIPVINGLTDEEHPIQIIADIMTIYERFNKYKDIKVAYLGDGRNNVAKSLMIGCAKLGMDISIGTPDFLFPEESHVNRVMKISKENNAKVIITSDPFEAVKDADVIYTDVWVSMGEENNEGINERIKSLKKYQVNRKIMETTGKKDAIFLHCLPASHENEIHNMEVTEEVFESKNSLVFDQAENRLHTIKAIFISLIKGE